MIYAILIVAIIASACFSVSYWQDAKFYKNAYEESLESMARLSLRRNEQLAELEVELDHVRDSRDRLADELTEIKKTLLERAKGKKTKK